MIKIGITGGIGSGKSTVCEVWKQLGAYIINADELAKEIMISDPIVKEKLIKTFGEESFHADGSLNRSFLAEQAFRKGRVEELNAIVHPQIPAEVDALMQKADDEGYKVVVFEAALLLQSLPRYDLDFVVLVLADKTRRSRWVQQRDEVPVRMVTDRMERQQNFEELKELADFLIRNDGSLDELREKAEEIYYKILNFNVDYFL